MNQEELKQLKQLDKIIEQCTINLNNFATMPVPKNIKERTEHWKSLSQTLQPFIEDAIPLIPQKDLEANLKKIMMNMEKYQIIKYAESQKIKSYNYLGSDVLKTINEQIAEKIKPIKKLTSTTPIGKEKRWVSGGSASLGAGLILAHLLTTPSSQVTAAGLAAAANTGSSQVLAMSTTSSTTGGNAGISFSLSQFMAADGTLIIAGGVMVIVIAVSIWVYYKRKEFIEKWLIKQVNNAKETKIMDIGTRKFVEIIKEDFTYDWVKDMEDKKESFTLLQLITKSHQGRIINLISPNMFQSIFSPIITGLFGTLPENKMDNFKIGRYRIHLIDRNKQLNKTKGNTKEIAGKTKEIGEIEWRNNEIKEITKELNLTNSEILNRNSNMFKSFNSFLGDLNIIAWVDDSSERKILFDKYTVPEDDRKKSNITSLLDCANKLTESGPYLGTDYIITARENFEKEIPIEKTDEIKKSQPKVIGTILNIEDDEINTIPIKLINYKTGKLNVELEYTKPFLENDKSYTIHDKTIWEIQLNQVNFWFLMSLSKAELRDFYILYRLVIFNKEQVVVYDGKGELKQIKTNAYTFYNDAVSSILEKYYAIIYTSKANSITRHKYFVNLHLEKVARAKAEVEQKAEDKQGILEVHKQTHEAISTDVSPIPSTPQSFPLIVSTRQNKSQVSPLTAFPPPPTSAITPPQTTPIKRQPIATKTITSLINTTHEWEYNQTKYSKFSIIYNEEYYSFTIIGPNTAVCHEIIMKKDILDQMLNNPHTSYNNMGVITIKLGKSEAIRKIIKKEDAENILEKFLTYKKNNTIVVPRKEKTSYDISHDPGIWNCNVFIISPSSITPLEVNPNNKKMIFYFFDSTNKIMDLNDTQEKKQATLLSNLVPPYTLLKLVANEVTKYVAIPTSIVNERLLHQGGWKRTTTKIPMTNGKSYNVHVNKHKQTAILFKGKYRIFYRKQN